MKRVLPILLVLLTGPVFAQTTVSISRASQTGNYPPGGTVDIVVTFTKDGPDAVTQLGLDEAIPPGWTFQGVVGGPAPEIQPTIGAEDELGFAWLFPPDIPFNLIYRLATPITDTGVKQIIGAAIYAINGGSAETSNSPTTNIQQGEAVGGEGEGEGAVEGEGAIEGGDPGEVVLDRVAVGDGSYPPNGTVDLSITLTHDGAGTVEVLGVTEQIPAGWTFNSVVSGAAPQITPAADAEGPLDFAYIIIPPFPVTFTYRLNVPAESTGDQSITGNGLYSFGGEQLETNTVLTTLTEGDPVVGEGEGEGEGTVEGEGEGGGGDTVVLSRSVLGDGTYPPGGTVDLQVTLTYGGSETVDTLGLTESIPPGWTFDRIVSGAAPPITPTSGSGGELDFAYIFVPPFPVTFVYRLRIPISASGDASISGTGVYSLGGAQIDTNTVVSTLSEGEPVVGEGEGEGEGGIEGEGGSNEVVLSRVALGGNNYNPGGTVDLEITFIYTGVDPVSVLGLEETIPVGWSFVGVIDGNAPPITPTPGAQGKLDFAYISVPPFPISFTYRVAVPAEGSGPQEISGNGLYSLGGPQVETNTVITSFTEGDPAEGEGEGAIEGEFEGEDEGEIPDTDLVLRRTPLGGTLYEPGATIEFRIRMTYTGEEALSALALKETLAPGWQFVGFNGGTVPQIAPSAGEEGQLDFAYIIPPPFPVEFNYIVEAPAEAEGAQVFTGEAVYRTSGPELLSNLATTTLQQIGAPNLVAQHLAGPSEAWVDQSVSASWTVFSAGESTARAPWNDCIYLSEDDVLSGEDILLGCVERSEDLFSGDFYQVQGTFAVPAVTPGEYFLILGVDDGDAVGEVDENDNTVASTAITVDTIEYEASLMVSLDETGGDREFVIEGVATDLEGGAGTSNARVAIDIFLRNQVRTVETLSDGSGAFSERFTLLETEGGAYSFGARHPGIPTAPVQASIEVDGLAVLPAEALLNLAPEFPETRNFEVINTGNPISGLAVSVLSAPDGVAIDAALAESSLASGAATVLSVTALAESGAPSGAAEAFIEINGGDAAATLRLNLNVLEATPILIPSVSPLRAGAQPGEQTLFSFELRNGGGASAEGLLVVAPELPWIKVAAPGGAVDLAPGEILPVSLQFLPEASQSTGLVSTTLNLISNGATLELPLQINVISADVGALQVTVEDELTALLPASPRVVGARVSLQQPENGTTIVSSTTAANGRVDFANVPVGPYDLAIRSSAHGPVLDTANITIGRTRARVLQAFRDFVVQRWERAPDSATNVNDFSVTVSVDETAPIPALTVEPPMLDLRNLATGETRQIMLTIRNRGNDVALGSRLRLSSTDAYAFTPLVEALGDIPPGATLEVPVLIEELGGGDACAVEAPSGLEYSYLLGDDIRQRREPLGVLLPTDRCDAVWPQFGALREALDGNGAPYVTAPILTQASACGVIGDGCGRAELKLSQGAVDTGSGVEVEVRLGTLVGGSNLSAIALGLQIVDWNGQNGASHFTIGNPVLSGISNITGSGALGLGNEATVRWRLTPGETAAAAGPFEVSANWNFRRLGVNHFLPLPVQRLDVVPLASTRVTLFLPDFVAGDDPATGIIEEASPFDFGMLFENIGTSPLQRLRLLNARPFIEEVDTPDRLSFFTLEALRSGSQSLLPGFQPTVGSLAANGIRTLSWQAATERSGFFIDLLFRLAREGAENSQRVLLASEVERRSLVRTVRVDSPVDDGAPDFLVNDTGTADAAPNALYVSDGGVLSVSQGANPTFELLDQSKQLTDVFRFTASMPSGWSYIRTTSPVGAGYVVSSVERSDGVFLPVENTWLTNRTVRDGANQPVNENRFHLLDLDSTGTYTVTFVSAEGVDQLPVADAGPDQTVTLAETVTLDGSASIDPEGASLSFAWTIVSAPAGSTATLNNAGTVTPGFSPDLRGVYEIRLVVNDGRNDSTPDTVLITVANRPPVAVAGGAQSGFVGNTIQLNSSGSSDPDGDPLTYSWRFLGRPVGSAATISNPTGASPSFVADRKGNYLVELVVNDGFDDSPPATVAIVIGNRAPVADAGPDRNALVGDTINLDGSGSSDLDNDPLTYQWTFVARPAQSTASIQNAQSVNASFVIDVPGDYSVRLVVNDGEVNSAPDVVTISTQNSRPVANAGPDRSGRIGDPVQLDGTASTDADNDPLTYQWTFLSRPSGSFAQFDNPASATPTFIVDVAGQYQIQLIVNDGRISSLPDSVLVTTENAPPVANAGSDQSRQVGQTVNLNGGASSDPDGDELSFSWSFVNRPSGSTATLNNPSSVTPSFVIDEPGNYLIELIVSDGQLSSLPDLVTVSTVNSRPVANAGPDQTLTVGTTAILSGAGSSDVDNDQLSFRWNFVSRPSGSTATLLNPNSVAPRFVVDRAGEYEVRLIVNDGQLDSTPDTVIISTRNSAPVANPGQNRTARVGDVVELDGSNSSDVDNDSLSFRWSFTSRPEGSTAVIEDREEVRSRFTVDQPGSYVVRLVVNDGELDSQPASITINTVNSRPVADPGNNQTRTVGSRVTLDGSSSSDPDNDELSFRWSFTARPENSQASLDNNTSVTPRFDIDLPGLYVIQLIVNDGQQDSEPATVQVTTENSAPVANAGPDQTASVGETVQLDGSGSFDVDGDTLSYAWSVTSRPSGSTTALSNPNAQRPTLVLDQPGAYSIQLIVRDAERSSVPDTVTIRTDNSRPVANPGSGQTRLVGQTVTLDGSGSTDPDGDALSFFWSFTTRPAGSGASLSNANNPVTSFVLDVPGDFVVQLVVNDGRVNSLPATVRITTGNTRPTANAGPDQQVDVGAVVRLDGRGSADPDGQELSYRWSLTTRPAGSNATLNNTALAQPQFTADLVGEYRAQLIVNDGELDSAADSVVILAGAGQPTCEPPAAPEGVSASDGAFSDRVTVTWSALSEDVLYRVWRSETNEPEDAAPISGWIEETLFNDTTAAPPDVTPASGCGGQATVDSRFFFYFVQARLRADCEGPLSADDRGHRGAEAKLMLHAPEAFYLDALPVAAAGEVAVIAPNEAVFLRVAHPEGVGEFWADIQGDQPYKAEWMYGGTASDGWVKIAPLEQWESESLLIVSAGGATTAGETIGAVTRHFEVRNTRDDLDGLPLQNTGSVEGETQMTVSLDVDGEGYRLDGVAGGGVAQALWLPIDSVTAQGPWRLEVFVNQPGLYGWMDAGLLEAFLAAPPTVHQFEGQHFVLVEAWHGGIVRVKAVDAAVSPANVAGQWKSQGIVWALLLFIVLGARVRVRKALQS